MNEIEIVQVIKIKEESVDEQEHIKIERLNERIQILNNELSHNLMKLEIVWESEREKIKGYMLRADILLNTCV